LRLNGALFYYDYANVQVIQLFGITQTVANGAKAELYGLDVDFEAKLAPGLRVSGGAVLLHANFTRYPNAVFSTPSATGGSIIGVGDASGNRLPLAQKFNGTLSVDYSWPTSSGEFAVNMTNSYNGNYFFESDNYTAQNAYVISNISTSWTSPGRGITAQFWVRNLFDKKVISQAAAQNFIVSTTYSNAPRTYGVTTTVMF
jgi:iron complex outermembrane receptor protein